MIEVEKSDSDREIPLPPGRITDGVVRIGNTVRRPSNAASPFIRSLLNHLERKGFDGVPRYLGTDERGRDILTYLPGAVATKWQFYPDETIRLAGQLLRGFHDGSVGCELLRGKPVMCHHDPGPNNVVFEGTRPIAFIDFDMIAPWERLEDLGYMAWSWCISAKPSRQPVEIQATQVAVLACAYDIAGNDRPNLFDAIIEGQSRNIQFWLEIGENSSSQSDITKSRQMIEWTRSERAYTLANRNAFLRALT